MKTPEPVRGNASQHEAGLLLPLDGLVHAVHLRISGPMALCGAGRIQTRLVGRFDQEAADACPACQQLLGDRRS